MAGTVVIKWGGGLITHKDKLCTVNDSIIEELAAACEKSSKKLVIVHGAGCHWSYEGQAIPLSRRPSCWD